MLLIFYSIAVVRGMHAVVETSIFSRQADALLSPDERAALIDTLARDPLAGDLIPGLGSVRKLRFAPKGRGKSGAFRVIYYVLTDDLPILSSSSVVGQRMAVLLGVERSNRLVDGAVDVIRAGERLMNEVMPLQV